MVDKQTVDRCLDGIRFPVEAQTIVDCAQVNECPSDVISQIRDSSTDTFMSEEQVLCALGSSVYC